MADLIQPADVRHVAKLARLTLREDEIPLITEQMVRILGYIAQLSEVDTSNVEPTAQVGVSAMPLRPDVIREGVSREDALQQAPETAGFGFVVPSFVED